MNREIKIKFTKRKEKERTHALQIFIVIHYLQMIITFLKGIYVFCNAAIDITPKIIIKKSRLFTKTVHRIISRHIR